MSHNALTLLRKLIATPSLSRQEGSAADVVEQYLLAQGLKPNRLHNNLWVLGEGYDESRPTLMLNSHIDTVKPSPSYTLPPFTPLETDDKIYGLGSNDAGASVVSLIATFLRFSGKNLPVNLLLAITAEEEVSGEHGMRALLPELARHGISVDMAIVGEPTDMQPAIAERGLVVLDCVAHGVAGHAARNEGVNAIYKAITDIEKLRNLRFDNESATLGPVKISVTQIEAGHQHNVVPDQCRFVVDVRTTDAYTNEQTVELIRAAIESEATPRSTRIHASVIGEDHPLVQAAVKCGGTPFVSPTTSDMALMPGIASLKIGPGQSSRSHSADEYIYKREIIAAIDKYSQILQNINIPS